MANLESIIATFDIKSADSTALKKLRDDLDKYEQELKQVEKGTLANEQATKRLSTAYNNLDKSTKNVENSQQKFGKDLNKNSNNFNTFGKSMSNLAGKASAYLGAIFAVDAIINQIISITKLTAKYQSLEKSIRFASGAVGEGNLNMRFLNQTANKLGLDLEATIEGFKTFNGALIEQGFTADKSRKIYEQVASAATVMGLSADDTKGVFLALGQIISKGTVQSEELRGQLGERLPGAFNIAAKSMGVTTAELGKLLEQGKVVSSDFLPKFAAELEKTFAGGLTEATDSLQANINRADAAYNRFLLTIGGNSEPAIKKGLKLLEELSNELTSFFQSDTQKIADLSAAKLEEITKTFSDFELPANFGKLDEKGQAKALEDVNNKINERINLLGQELTILQQNQVQAAKYLNQTVDALDEEERKLVGNVSGFRRLAEVAEGDFFKAKAATDAQVQAMDNLIKRQKDLTIAANKGAQDRINKSKEEAKKIAGLARAYEDFLNKIKFALRESEIVLERGLGQQLISNFLLEKDKISFELANDIKEVTEKAQKLGKPQIEIDLIVSDLEATAQNRIEKLRRDLRKNLNLRGRGELQGLQTSPLDQLSIENGAQLAIPTGLTQTQVEEENKLLEERKKAYEDFFKQVGRAAADFTNYMISEADREVAARTERINYLLAVNTEAGDRLAQIEEERRADALQKREKYVRTQKILGAIEAAANIAVGISKVFAESGVASIGTLPAILAILGVALAAAPQLIAPFFEGFKDGVVDYKGKGTEKSDSNPVMISRGESVITAKGTDKAPKALKMINKGQLTDAMIFGFKNILSAPINIGEGELSKKLDKTNNLLAGIAPAIASMPQTSFHIDENGYYKRVKRMEIKRNKINNRR